jgi:hypothetical protein
LPRIQSSSASGRSRTSRKRLAIRPA